MKIPVVDNSPDPYAMPEALLSDPPDLPPSGSPSVWSPKAVAVITFLISFPASFPLMVLNWRRLGQKQRILPHIFFLFPASVALTVASLYLPDKPGRGLFFAFNLCLLAYFRNRMASDIEEFKRTYPAIALTRLHWSKALPWSLFGLVVFFALTMAVFFIATVFFSYEPPEETSLLHLRSYSGA